MTKYNGLVKEIEENLIRINGDFRQLGNDLNSRLDLTVNKAFINEAMHDLYKIVKEQNKIINHLFKIYKGLYE